MHHRSLNALTEAELPSASVQYTSDKFVALNYLESTKGKLRYLKVQTLLLIFLIPNLLPSPQYSYNYNLLTMFKVKPKCRTKWA